MIDALVAGLSALRVDADDKACAKLSQYIGLLDKWNPVRTISPRSAIRRKW